MKTLKQKIDAVKAQYLKSASNTRYSGQLKMIAHNQNGPAF